MQRIVKAKTHKGRRILEARESQAIETEKRALVINGLKTSGLVNAVLSDLYILKKPAAARLSRKNDLRPFEDTGSLEFLMEKNECSLFVLGTHQKKRPHTLTLGRTFNKHLLDCIELGVLAHKPLLEFKAKLSVEGRPLLIFQGGGWELNEDLIILRNLLLDYFRGVAHEGELNLGGVERAIVVTAGGGSTIELRQYTVELKNAGGRIPHVQLEEAGPQLDFTVRRSVLADRDARAAAVKPARHVRKVKNVEAGLVGQTLGRVHLGRQDLTALSAQTRLPKALRHKRAPDEDGGDAGDAAGVDEDSDDDAGESPTGKRHRVDV
eukprot:TRINITY_DN412_c0_g1_i4.p1 TRINITY_DN412_c0_g1~~TRINITY_DN412_c0_g1_i4.p1  ORF type:complete len:323 (-),score=62.25 TRINITY_DN412_c0_g1_i4:139-1107(-)